MAVVVAAGSPRWGSRGMRRPPVLLSLLLISAFFEMGKLKGDKEGSSTKLAEMERYKRLAEEQKVKLESSLSDREGQISKEQIVELQESEKEGQRLRERLKELEGPPNATAAVEDEKKQGEDKEHGLAAEDKSEVQVVSKDAELDAAADDVGKIQDIDDRKRDQVQDNGSNPDEEASKLDKDLDAAKLAADSFLRSSADEEMEAIDARVV